MNKKLDKPFRWNGKEKDGIGRPNVKSQRALILLSLGLSYRLSAEGPLFDSR
jgi:hypothetical protein